MTNPGFEAPLSNKGFGWRHWNPDNAWQIQRLPGNAASDDYALRITFSGEKNIQFYHLWQLIPVQPLQNYTLSFWWRSQDISTDQLPYIEVRDFDCQFFSINSPMAAPSSDWEKITIDFSVPQDCHAVRIRVRRDKSHRFDSKIKGRLWLDNFQLIDNE